MLDFIFTILSLVFIWLPLAYTAIYVALKAKGIIDRNKVRAALFALPDVTVSDKVAAWADMQAAFKADLKTIPYDYSAPFVTAIALIGRPDDATTLPAWARKWDNNISINGDALAVFRDGQWLDLRNGNEARPGEQVFTYDDEEYDGKAYYAKRLHPRSYLARWIFVGLRNRASALSQQLGCEVTEYPRVISGARNLSASNAGHFLLQAGKHFHFKTVTKTRIAGRDWAVIRSYGHKLEISMMQASGWDKAAAVAIGWSAKRWKGN